VTLGPRFRRLWTASATSNLGDGLFMTAVPLLAASLTRDPLLVSGVTASLFLPWLFFALPGGALVDRMDRRIAMARTGWFRTLVLGALTFTVGLDVVNIWIVYLAVFLLGSAETVYESAARAMLPAVVTPRASMRETESWREPRSSPRSSSARRSPALSSLCPPGSLCCSGPLRSASPPC